MLLVMMATPPSTLRHSKGLLASGAGFHADNKGFTSLMVASSFGHDQVVQHLLASGADIHAVNNDGCTSLVAASQAGHDQVVQCLLSDGAKVDAATHDGATALLMASQEGAC